MTIIIYLVNESTCIKKIRKYGGTAASLFVDRLFVTVSVKSSIWVMITVILPFNIVYSLVKPDPGIFEFGLFNIPAFNLL